MGLESPMMKNHFILSYGWGGVGYVQGASLKSNADLWFFRFFLTPRSSGFLAALLWLGSWSNFRNRRDFPATCAYSFCVINLPKNIRSIVVLTGAGISAESGITTFRAEDGLWCNHRIEDVATPEGFERDPVLVQQFYNQRRAQLTSVAPNAAHYALAQLAEAFKGSFLLVTQNVDDLHDRAFLEHRPSERFNFYHMHGELKKMRCEESGIIYDCMDDIKTETLCGCCQEAGTLRPHIVWFGEMPLHMPQISHALGHCDLFLSIGTSGNVYPAAGFVAEARHAGAYTVELNLEPSQVHSLFDATRHGKATALVPEFVQILLRE